MIYPTKTSTCTDLAIRPLDYLYYSESPYYELNDELLSADVDANTTYYVISVDNTGILMESFGKQRIKKSLVEIKSADHWFIIQLPKEIKKTIGQI